MEVNNAKIERPDQMPVFQLLHRLSIDVAELTRLFQRDFTWLKIQVNRSAESVTTNIVEGFYAQYSTEYLQSLYRSRREGRETQHHLVYARDARVSTIDECNRLIAAYEDGLKQLNALIRSIERKIQLSGKAKPSAQYLLREGNGIECAADSGKDEDDTYINHPP